MFQLRLGDQVFKVNKYLMHIIFSIYKDDYLGKDVLSKQDEELLKKAVGGTQNENLIGKVEGFKDKLLSIKIKESKKQDYRDEWFEFQDEENVYEETLHRTESPHAFQFEPSLKRPPNIDTDLNKFKIETEDEEAYSKATMGLHPPEEGLSPFIVRLDESDGEDLDKELESQLSNRYHNKFRPTSDFSHKLPSMLSDRPSTRPYIRDAGDALASPKPQTPNPKPQTPCKFRK